MLESIKQILDRKGHGVLCITSDATIYEALKMMAGNNVGALVVMEDGHVVGMFSERDYARELEFCSHSCLTIKVRDVMSKDIYFVKPETLVDEAMAIVTETRCRHLPVMDGEEMVGMVSIGDLVKASIDKKDFVIKQLEKYIKGEH
jgi:CBS domain-containing protein